MSMTTRKPVTLRLYLIRHGETEWSLSGQYTGRTDIPLTAHGEDAARDLGQRLRVISFAHVLTSPLQRARQTCALAALGPTPEIEPDLAEWDNGDDEGQTPADILQSRPGWNLFRDGSPHGETPAQMSNRVDRFIARLRLLDGNVALFSHGHFGRVLAARWIGLSVEQAQHLLLDTASLSVLCYEHDRTDQPAIALWNSAAHETFDRALERATHLRKELGSGSLTALPIIETEAQDISAYIPTNLISITDGQIYLSPSLFELGVLPAVDVGKSVSRVGGKAQRATYRAVAGDLKLAYSRFEELETFARFGARLDEDTRKIIDHGRRIRACLKQSEFAPVPVPAQVAVLLALTAELFDRVPLLQMTDAEHAVREAAADIPAEVRERLDTADKLSDEDRETIIEIARETLKEFSPEPGYESEPEPEQKTKEQPQSESTTEPKSSPKHETGPD